MRPIKTAFQIQLDKVSTLFKSSAHQPNPAIWLYLNDLRTPFFMLEALSRIAEGVYEKKTFDELRLYFKSIEDGLGAFDHYAAIFRLFENEKSVSLETLSYFRQRAYDSAENLNNTFYMNGWLDATALANIEKVLKKIRWKDADKEIDAVYTFYKNEIKECIDFAKETKYHFDNVEEDVHELRRKIRWLSIYPQAMSGAIQYSSSAAKPKAHQVKYQTPEVVNSPYNTFPNTIKVDKPLLMDKNNFLALSWTIAELGSLKDEGLKIEALVEAYQNTSFMKTDAAYEKAYKILGKKQIKMQSLLDRAEVICKTFFEEKILDGLVTK